MSYNLRPDLRLKQQTASNCWNNLVITILFVICHGMLCGVVYGQTRSGNTNSPTKFPYRAAIKSDQVQVHSGPGQVHYPTGKLSLGDVVEVYRLDPGGWCAIRPPEGSFSLIPAESIERVDDAIGEVLEAGTQAWIGTELGPVEVPLWQVKLKQGEKLKLLGEALWPDPDGTSSVWYQIAPPSGEFRWVHVDGLEIQPTVVRSQADYPWSSNAMPTNGIRSNRSPDPSSRDPRNNSVESLLDLDNWSGQVGSGVSQANHFDRSGNRADHVREDGEVNRASYQHSSDLSDSSNLSQRSAALSGSGETASVFGWRRATRPIRSFAWDDANSNSSTTSNAGSKNWGTSDSFAPASSMGVSDSRANEDQQAPDRMASSSIDSRFDFQQLLPNGASGGFTQGLLTNRMTELELQLNQEMLRAPSLWRLQDIQERAQKVLDTTQDSIEQLQAQRFMAKLENCRRIRNNFLGGLAGDLSRSANRDSTTGDSLAARQGTEGFGNQNGAEEITLATMYDAYGRLNELVREGGKLDSTYVLQNEEGKITHHVAAGPGMSLSSYRGKRVGIIGQRGYHTRLKLDHVTAQKIIELKDR